MTRALTFDQQTAVDFWEILKRKLFSWLKRLLLEVFYLPSQIQLVSALTFEKFSKESYQIDSKTVYEGFLPAGSNSVSHPNPWSSCLGLFCHVPLKRDKWDRDWRLRLNDTPNARLYQKALHAGQRLSWRRSDSRNHTHLCVCVRVRMSMSVIMIVVCTVSNSLEHTF